MSKREKIIKLIKELKKEGYLDNNFKATSKCPYRLLQLLNDEIIKN